MTDDQTCGRGLAENAALPARLAEVIAAVADNLERHIRTLDTSDPAARTEREAYERLVRSHSETAAKLRAIADELTSYGDLPVAAHNEEAFADPALLEAFEALTQREEELSTLMQTRVEGHHKMLKAWRSSQ